jgi:UDP-N-acetylmuramoyl-L-alanyl-D-glutamate--2,6-diaminopimelate ligase
MPLAALLPDLTGAVRDRIISGLAQDTRLLHAGEAFVALPAVGGGVHGITRAEDARARGAAVVLFESPLPAGLAAPAEAIGVPALGARLGTMADQFHASPSRAMRVVGITGTNGKSSTAQLLAQAWTLAGLRAGSIGTLGAGLYGEEVATGFTTPQVLQVHALLAALRDAGAQAVAMEVSSHALDQGRVDGVHFEVAVFTNLTRDHLDYHPDMAAYGEAKARLFTHGGLAAVVLNLDDDFARRLLPRIARGVRVIGVSAAGRDEAALRAEGITLDAQGIGFVLASGEHRHAVRSPLLGRFNVDNLLAVGGVLVAMDMPLPMVTELLGRLQPVSGRMNRLGGEGGQPLVVVDYAHTPDALEQALATLRAHTRGRLWLVFGCGGERDAGKRPLMGALAERLADVAIVTDDNPRGEDGDRIIAGILAGFGQPARAQVQRDRARAIAMAIDAADAGDVVLVAGKGHEPYQEIAGVKHPFDDAVVARHMLEARA